MIVKRPFWEELIEKAWLDRSIIWLMGVRRVGKTSLCHSLPNITYFDCELPKTRALLDDPEGFLENQKGKRIVLDEIHRLDNPSEILKIAADHYPSVKVIATGSSTLGASAKFRDTLTGRKREVWLTPMLLEEMAIFGSTDLRHRMLFGGFPFYFVQKEFPEVDFSEWISSYWAKDIQELFKVEKRNSFLKFTELLLAQSGGQFEATKFADACEVSRPSISNYLAILEETFVVHVIRPYFSYRASEIVKAPKVYGFDTGFVCFFKGWNTLRQDDVGLLWEQCVLNELEAKLQKRFAIHYWRDKQGHEIDFVLPERGDNSQTIIECKFSILQDIESAMRGIAKNVAAFRAIYPEGKNFICASNVDRPYQKKYGELTFDIVNPQELTRRLVK
jgi:predicted AAA+ superfamily ATPase